MKDTKNQLCAILPPRLRRAIPEPRWQDLTEIRLRLGAPPGLSCLSGYLTLPGEITADELQFCINTASRYSPWSAASMAQGYLTAPGGHRIGICGSWNQKGFTQVSSLCIRVARDFPGISRGISLKESVLILGPPGCGKTTLLRDLVRRLSREGSGAVCVVDERDELFPLYGGSSVFEPGPHTDILSGCSKDTGLPMALRTMGPAWIAVDEISAQADCQALIQAGWCGVRLLATAHAAGTADLLARPVYAPLVQAGLFHNVIVLGPDKRWHTERLVV